LALKERYQNPVIGDTVRLRLFMYNGNSLNDVVSVDSIYLYVCDPSAATMEDPTGRTLVEELDTTQVVHECTGTYYIDVPLTSPQFVLGKYTDEWTMTVDSNIPAQTIQNEFRIFPQLWYSTPVPVVYDFSFDFQPNKVRKGSKQYLRIRITPNVPKATDLARYYENLAIVGDVKVSLEQKCGPCLPTEQDLRMVIDEEPVTYKEKCFGYYLLDTEDMDCGVYAIWFTLCLGGNKYISDKMNIQIFD
jgi:hypothetical protein